MEKYTINGHEFEYDTFELVNVELFDSEMKRIKDICKEGDGALNVRPLCEAITDMFDLLIGEGTSEIAFGGRMNVKELLEAFSTFTNDVINAVNMIQTQQIPIPASHAMNREQSRAEERKRKRAEAKSRVESNAG